MNAFLYKQDIKFNLISDVCIDIHSSEEILAGLIITSLIRANSFFKLFHIFN